MNCIDDIRIHYDALNKVYLSQHGTETRPGALMDVYIYMIYGSMKV